ncbi:MAG: cupin-like domain-containing protein [Legionella sp.]|uniref:cupin-like domain-containing protein n=1 Tax=Legionella sp. TaxID=459 RepID=UPI002845A4B5|nr:cupin-like domain-containing protein [Legionella sp.]
MKLNKIDSLAAKLPWFLKFKYTAQFILEHLMGGRLSARFLSKSQAKLKQQIHACLAATPQKGRSTPITEVSDLSPHEFFQYSFQPGVPVVFRGIAKDWPACKEWDFNYFATHYGKEPVLFVNHEAYGNKENKSDFELSTLEEYLGSLDKNDGRYARFHPLLDRYPELKKYLNLEWLTERMSQKLLDGFVFNVLFLGKKDSVTNCHNEGNDNLFLQVTGTKKWFLWPTDYSYIFQPRANRGPAKYCDINPLKPQLNKYLGYEYLDYYEVDLEPGDILYVPAYTWHYTKNVTSSIGVGTRWTSLKNTFRRSPLLCIFEFLNTNPSLFSTLFSKDEFDFNRMIIKSMGYKREDIK